MAVALVACEQSGQVRTALRLRGIDAWSCDLEPDWHDSPYHIQADVRTLDLSVYRLLIAHPPCPRLCLAGVQWLHKRSLWAELDEAAALFRYLLHADVEHIALENPVMHRHAVERVGRNYDFCYHPWQFGDNFSKKTCFWVKALPRLITKTHLNGRTARHAVHYERDSVGRSMRRSLLYPGMLNAMADQWKIYCGS